MVSEERGAEGIDGMHPYGKGDMIDDILILSCYEDKVFLRQEGERDTLGIIIKEEMECCLNDVCPDESHEAHEEISHIGEEYLGGKLIPV